MNDVVPPPEAPAWFPTFVAIAVPLVTVAAFALPVVVIWWAKRREKRRAAARRSIGW